MSERNYYVICDDNCRFEGMTKEQIIAAIAEATGATPTHIDDAFITKLKETNANRQLKFWVGTTAQYNALPEIAENTFYILTDETFGEDISAAIVTLQNEIERIKETTDKKGVILLDDTVPFGTGISFNISENIVNYDLVKVQTGNGEILCNVYHSGENELQIVGSGGVSYDSTLYDSAIFNVILFVNTHTHKITSNLSRVLTFSASGSERHTKSIEKITGII